MTSAPEPFNLRVDRQGAVAVLAIDGDFDGHAVPAVTAEVDRLLRGGASRIEVDASSVAFADSSALRALLIAQRKAAGAGGGLCVTKGSDALNRVLDMTGLDQVLCQP